MNNHRRNRSAGRGHDARARVVRHGTLAAIRDWLGGLVGNQSGIVALLFALVLLPIAIAAGFAVDFGRAYAVKARMAYALDAAGLAVGSSVGTDAELQEILQNYFDANYPAEEFGVPAVPTMEIVDNVINLSVTANLDTVLMRIVGYDQIDIAIVATIIKETTGIELVLVLDNTGSMRSGGKMNALKAAAQDLVDIIYAGAETIPDLWVGLVPYTITVNIGPERSDWLDPGDRVFDDDDDDSDDDDSDGNPYDPSTWKGCVDARPPFLDQDDSPPAAGLFTSFFYPADDDNRWPPVNENNGAQNNGKGPNLGCGPEITSLVAERSTVSAAIAEMLPWHRGGTAGNLGLSWGWRVLSPQWRGLWGDGTPPDLPVDYDEPLIDKVVVMMTDGINQFYDWPGNPLNNGNGPNGSDHTSYGRLTEFGYSYLGAARDELDARMAATCQSMKDVGIIIYTITFGPSPDGQAQNLFRACATAPNYYFHAPSNAHLAAAFRLIGEQLSNLRIGS